MKGKIKRICAVIMSILLICQTNLVSIKDFNLIKNSVSVQAASKPKTIKLNKKTITLEVGKKQTLKAIITPSSAKSNIKWSSTNKKVAVVSSKGTVRGIKAGIAVITATTKNGKKSACKVTVKKTKVEATSVKINQDDLTLNIDDIYTLSATISPSNVKNKNLTWISEDEDIVYVDSDGELIAIQEGVTTITVKSSNGKKASIKVTVIESEDFTDDTGNHTTQETTSEDETEPTSEDKTEPTSENETEPLSEDKTEPLSENGTEPTTEHKTEPLTEIPTESKEVQTIQLNAQNKQCTVGDTFSLSATISPSNATNKTVTWSSSNTGLATVDNSGKVITKSVGTVEITAKTSNGKVTKCTVVIVAKTPTTIEVTSIQISNQELQKTEGETVKLTATILPSNATNKTVTWSSSNTAVAVVDNSGLVTAKSAGKADITVKSNNGKTTKCTITVKAKIDTPTRAKFSEGIYRITLANTDKVLDVEGFGTNNGTKVNIYGWRGTINQVWYLQNVGNTVSFISQCAPDKVLDIMRTNNSTKGELKAGCYTDIYQHNDCPAQDFYIDKFSDGTCIIRLVSNTNLVLQADSTSEAAAVKIANYDVNNKLQRWNIIEASLPASSNKVLTINMNNISQIGNQKKAGDNVMCGAYAIAYARSYLDNKITSPFTYWINNVGANWSVGGGSSSKYSNTSQMLAVAKQRIDMGKPSIINVYSPSIYYQHYVLIVGYTGTGDSVDKFTILDPWDGTQKSLNSYPSAESGGWQCQMIIFN